MSASRLSGDAAVGFGDNFEGPLLRDAVNEDRIGDHVGAGEEKLAEAVSHDLVRAVSDGGLIYDKKYSSAKYRFILHFCI